MLLISAPMAGVQSSTLIECRRTDGRTIAGAADSMFVVIAASNLWAIVGVTVRLDAANPFG
jgi:hypothetical protein